MLVLKRLIGVNGCFKGWFSTCTGISVEAPSVHDLPELLGLRDALAPMPLVGVDFRGEFAFKELLVVLSELFRHLFADDLLHQDEAVALEALALAHGKRKASSRVSMAI